MNTLTNFKRTFRLAWLAVGVMFLFPASSWGQGQPAPPPPQAAATPEQQPVVVIKKESKLVLVDSVVTDKKGNYVRELTQNDFKVFEDNKEQPVSTFSTGADAATQANGQRRYLILFFDNSTMAAPDAPVTVASAGFPSLGSSLGNAAADFGARSMLLAVRSLAKNLRSIPGRKMVVLFSGGFPLKSENQSELTATIDACNKSNVAVYALDARGLVATAPGGSASRRSAHGS